LGSLLKITEVAKIFGLLFSTEKDYANILTKNRLGYILVDFFTNSSGRPDRDPYFVNLSVVDQAERSSRPNSTQNHDPMRRTLLSATFTNKLNKKFVETT
jgi:hypothetical protein